MKTCCMSNKIRRKIYRVRDADNDKYGTALNFAGCLRENLTQGTELRTLSANQTEVHCSDLLRSYNGYQSG